MFEEPRVLVGIKKGSSGREWVPRRCQLGWVKVFEVISANTKSDLEASGNNSSQLGRREVIQLQAAIEVQPPGSCERETVLAMV